MGFRKIVKFLIPMGVFNRVEPLGHLLEALLLNIINGFPARNLRVIGVTGTNGKTSTTYLIHKMLQEAGYKVGMMSTVAYGVNDDFRPQIHHMTNVSAPEMMKRLRWFKRQDIDWLVLETTSHALAQNRTWGVPYSVAVMTNVTHEHLDYHGTFDKYLEAKLKLFWRTNRNYKGERAGIVNADDDNADMFKKATANCLTYGLKRGDLKATKIKQTSGGSRYTAKIGKDEYKIECHLPGSFNVSNSLAAVATGRIIGLTKKQIEKGIAALKGVEGRMTIIDEGQDFDVIVDFAHTPDSFEKLFNDLRPVVKGKLIVMFGSAGRRDEAKRAVQGEIAGKHTDIVVVTEEDDRDVDGNEIMAQIASGAEKAGKTRNKNLFLVHNRTEAVKFTVDLAKKGDTVMLLGKGHEKTIERANGEHPWDEISVVRRALKQ